jgi:hypothetical protein
MGSLRDLKRDPTRVPKPAKRDEQEVCQLSPHQTSTYAPPSGTGIVFDNFQNGYCFSVDTVTMNTMSPSHMQYYGQGGFPIKLPAMAPTPTIYVNDYTDPSVLSVVWNWTTNFAKRDGRLKYFDANGNVTQEWKLYGCLF